ncbi:hypothetical protein N9L80_02770 [Luminiphilus sp.]|nr:hypothetical protein [Luminiphilus sp.]
MKTKLLTAVAVLLACSQAWAEVEVHCPNSTETHWVGLIIDFDTEEVRYSKNGGEYKDCKEASFSESEARIKCSVEADDRGFERRISLNYVSRLLKVEAVPVAEPALSGVEPGRKFEWGYVCWDAD